MGDFPKFGHKYLPRNITCAVADLGVIENDFKLYTLCCKLKTKKWSQLVFECLHGIFTQKYEALPIEKPKINMHKLR